MHLSHKELLRPSLHVDIAEDHLPKCISKKNHTSAAPFTLTSRSSMGQRLAYSMRNFHPNATSDKKENYSDFCSSVTIPTSTIRHPSSLVKSLLKTLLSPKCHFPTKNNSMTNFCSSEFSDITHPFSVQSFVKIFKSIFVKAFPLKNYSR